MRGDHIEIYKGIDKVGGPSLFPSVGEGIDLRWEGKDLKGSCGAIVMHSGGIQSKLSEENSGGYN